MLRQNFAGVLADGVAASGFVEVLRARRAGDHDIVDAKFFAELFDIRLLVKGAHLVKRDLHIHFLPLQMKIQGFGQPVGTKRHPGGVVAVGGVDLVGAGAGAVPAVGEKVQLIRHVVFGQGAGQHQ